MNLLNYKHLYYFYVVAREGSVKAASEKLHVSQPTISDQLRLLEEHLEARLFERKNRGLHLTVEGKLAVGYAEKIFDLGTELTSRLRNNLSLPKKTLDIGITHFMSHYFIYQNILPAFELKEVSAIVNEGERVELLSKLEEGVLDMIFTDNKDSLSLNTKAYAVGLNRTFVIAHKKFRKYQKNFPQGLESLPFFNYTKQSNLKYEIDLFFSKNGIAPKVMGEGDDIDLMQIIAEKGLAFAVVPEVAMRRMCKGGEIISLGEIKDFQTTVWCIMKKDYRGVGYKLIRKGA